MLIIVLWIAVGLVSIALYFANSMTFELRASDNRASGLAADQAIEGAARYVSHILADYATNGTVPLETQYQSAGVQLGDARFWLIGRDPSGTAGTQPYFGLIDEASKLNLNTVNTNTLLYLPNMTMDIAEAIVDWRSTNGTMSLNYGTYGYLPKHAAFETVSELRLVDGVSLDLLAGSDANHNGILDANEKNVSSVANYGLLEFLTIYTREPNFYADGTSLTNVNSIREQDLQNFFQSAGVSSATSRATTVYNSIQANECTGMFDFCYRCEDAGMSLDDITHIYDEVTTSDDSYIRGRVNVNTASADVLYALFTSYGVDQQTASSAADQLVTYRRQNPNNLVSVAWVIEALGRTSPVVSAMRNGDLLTTHSFQFTADIAAVGPFGRGYRRVKFIFDTSDGTPKIIYRQDLSRLGWALGDTVRETLLAQNTQ